MSENQFISVELVCNSYRIAHSWVEELADQGLIQIHTVETQGHCVELDHLATLERMINLNQDLGVNVAGIEVIMNLLNRIEQLEKELTDRSVLLG